MQMRGTITVCKCSHAKCGLRKGKSTPRRQPKRLQGKKESQKRSQLYFNQVRWVIDYIQRDLANWRVGTHVPFSTLFWLWEGVGCGTVWGAQALDQNGAGLSSQLCHTAGACAEASPSFHFYISGRGGSKNFLSRRVDVKFGNYVGEVLRTVPKM